MVFLSLIKVIKNKSTLVALTLCPGELHFPLAAGERSSVGPPTPGCGVAAAAPGAPPLRLISENPACKRGEGGRERKFKKRYIFSGMTF